MGMMSEFKDFAMRGSVMDMAVGIIIGGAFGKIVSSFVNDIMMPPISKIMGANDVSELWAIPLGDPTVNDAGETVPAAAIKVGSLLQATIDFVIIAFAIFMVIKLMNSMKKKEEAAPAAPPKQEVLLEEIRDLLKK